MSKISLALVDDHQIVIDGLMALLKGEHRYEFAFATTRPGEVMDKLRSCHVDVLLTDVMMPELPGNLLVKEIHKEFPELKILALSMSGEGAIVNEMINDADISGYILKNVGKKELVAAIEKIAAGGIYFSEDILDALKKTADLRKENEKAHLTERELEIIRLIETEYNNRQIAEKLFISERTVETHRKNIFRKTGTNTVIGLVKYAYEHKLI
jgi:two-component system, NarL family, nitrate/nitrite response regulator NarL